MNIVDISGNDFFNNPAALFEKAKYDNTRISNNKSSEQNMVYALFDTIITINHLFDWVMQNKDENVKKECINSFNPFENIEQAGKDYKKYFSENSFPDTNISQSIIRGLSNNFKHYKVSKLNLSETKINVAQAGLMCAGQTSAVAGYYEITFEVKDCRNNQIYDLLSLLNVNLKRWEEFFDQIFNEEKHE
ncbi:MAG: hypothetical protein LBH32_08235 [Dysgonamonadaceae bacterium]|nr:hypothetical protein [Dysgonamonadaceae bacterium]